jgi:hypothetical protein
MKHTIINQQRKILPILVMMLLGVKAFSQETLQVVTKSIDKTFDRSQNLKIDAEKADIELMVWDGDKIKVNIELVAKHPDRKMALKDLEMLKYVADKFGNEIVLRNYLQTQNESNKIESNLKAKYVIKIPESMAVSIHNSFGKISVSGKYKLLQLKTDFCNAELKNITGNLKLDTHYGDVLCQNISGKINIKTDRTNLTVNDISEECIILSQYGKLKIQRITNLQKLNIDAQKSEITLVGIPLKNYAFHLVNDYGKLKIPSGFSSSTQNNHQVAMLNENLVSKIYISNSFGITSIEN